jgi:cellulose synthase (UDP-forming)
VPGYWAAILAYALPHLVLSNITNSRIQGQHRHSFWNEIYETVLSPYILLPTMLALINPKLGKFNVTAKGGVVKRSFFDVKIAQPFLVLLFFNFLGLLVAIPRFFIWDRDRPGTVIMNCIWCFFNIVVLGVCSAVSREMQQLRGHVRIKIVTPVTVKLSDGRAAKGETIDLSSGGTAIRLEPFEVTSPEQAAKLSFPCHPSNADLPVTLVSSAKAPCCAQIQRAHHPRAGTAHHGPLLPRRYMAGLGREPRDRSAHEESRAHLLPSPCKA